MLASLRQRLRPQVDALKPRAKRLLYTSGALDAYHRRRNKHVLTVIMFHRVLSPSDPRWATCDPEYSISDALFGDCLDFFRRHYNVVSLEEVLSAHAGRTRLPERPLLITFDDGWSDNEEFALERMRRAGLPGVIFVVADAVDRHEPFFQEQLVNAWRAGRLSAERARGLWAAAGGDLSRTPRFGGRDELEPVRALVAQLEELTPARREAVLSGYADVLSDGVRYMITTEQLRRLHAGGVAIGSHGKSHTPLAEAPDADRELSGSRQALGDKLGAAGAPPSTLSFPHGSFTSDVVGRARAAGYELMFTSVPELVPVGGPLPDVLGRVGFTTETVADEEGRFCPESLALHLFRKPHGGEEGAAAPMPKRHRSRS